MNRHTNMSGVMGGRNTALLNHCTICASIRICRSKSRLEIVRHSESIDLENKGSPSGVVLLVWVERRHYVLECGHNVHSRGS